MNKLSIDSSTSKPLKILITGASSELGAAAANILLNIEGLEISVISHRSIVNISGCKIVYGDLENKASLLRCVDGIDIIIHAAALTRSYLSSDYYNINTDGTKNLIEASLQGGVKKIIYISSAAVSPKEEGGAYSHSKLEAEQLIKNSRMKWLIIRPSQTYGGDLRTSSMDKLINLITFWGFMFIPVVGDGASRLSPVFFDDLVDGIISSVFSDEIENKIINLAGPQEYSYNEFVDRVAKFYKLKRVKIHLPLTIIQFFIKVLARLKINILAPDEITRLLCKKSYNINLAKEKIGYSPRNLAEGLKEINKS